MSANRFEEAREYVGLAIADTARGAGISAEQVRRIEAGEVAPTPVEMLCLSQLYQRPPAWLRGDPTPPVEISAELDNLMDRGCVSDSDRSEIVRFVEFLGHRATATQDPDHG